MNGYLILARCFMDDLPMGLFASRQDALNFALAVTADDLTQVATTLGLDLSDYLGLSVVVFEDGAPVEQENIGEWAD